MADVTISGLTLNTPNKDSAVIPYSDGSTTYKTSPSGIVAASPGCVLQVQQAVYSDQIDYNTGGSGITTWTDFPNLSVSITPKALNSKFLLNGVAHFCMNPTTSCNFRFVRNNSPIGVGSSGAGGQASFRNSNGNSQWATCASNIFLDNTILTNLNPIVYKLQFHPFTGDPRQIRLNNSFYIAGNNTDGFRCISTLTVQEIAG